MPTVPPAARIRITQNAVSAVSSPVFTVFAFEELLFTEGLFPEEDDDGVVATDDDGVTDTADVGVIFCTSSPFVFVWIS